MIAITEIEFLSLETKFYIIPKFSKYLINKYGVVFNNNTKKLEPYNKKYDLVNDNGDVETKEVERLLCDTFYGPSNIPWINEFPETIDSSKIKLHVDPTDIKILNENMIEISGMSFKRVKSLNYFISNNGICYNSETNCFIKASIVKGYYRCQTIGKLLKMSYLVHRIVYQIWTDTILPDDIEIDHVNGYKWDNYIGNLEPVSSLENIYRASLKKFLKPNQTSVEFIHLISDEISKGVPYKQIHEKYGISVPSIKQIASKSSYAKCTTDYDFVHSRKRLTTEEAKKVRELMNKEYTDCQISSILNIDVEIIEKFRKYKIQRKIRKGANQIHGNCKLTSKEVVQIWKLLNETSLSHTYIGKIYNVDRKVIDSINNKENITYNKILIANGLISEA